MASELVSSIIYVAAGNLFEFADFVFDQMLLEHADMLKFVPGAERCTVNGVEYRYILSPKSMGPADGFEFTGSWYLREDSREILERAQAIRNV